MYIIVNRQYVYKDITSMELTGSICDIVCDTANDIPTTQDIQKEKMLFGSWAWIISDKTYKVLNSQGVFE